MSGATIYNVNDRFWSGFGLFGCPDFSNKTVLDLGCGAGNRCLEAAEHGALRVIGLDTSDGHFAKGRARLASAPIAWRNRVSFYKGSLQSLPAETFDVVLSEDTFEHVMNVAELLAEVRQRLKIGGLFYVGFGPLYHAYDGDHGWLRDTLPGRKYFSWPWGHLILKGLAYRKLSRLHNRKVCQTHDWPYLDLNQHTVSEFEHMFRNSGMRIIYLKKNNVRSLKAKIYTALGKLPILATYFTINMFVILERHD
jgi:SAM-dependent methyltransferase